MTDSMIADKVFILAADYLAWWREGILVHLTFQLSEHQAIYVDESPEKGALLERMGFLYQGISL